MVPNWYVSVALAFCQTDLLRNGWKGKGTFLQAHWYEVYYSGSLLIQFNELPIALWKGLTDTQYVFACCVWTLWSGWWQVGGLGDNRYRGLMNMEERWIMSSAISLAESDSNPANFRMTFTRIKYNRLPTLSKDTWKQVPRSCLIKPYGYTRSPYVLKHVGNACPSKLTGEYQRPSTGNEQPIVKPPWITMDSPTILLKYKLKGFSYFHKETSLQVIPSEGHSKALGPRGRNRKKHSCNVYKKKALSYIFQRILKTSSVLRCPLQTLGLWVDEESGDGNEAL